MAFTGVLGNSLSTPSSFALGRADSPGGTGSFDQDVVQDVVLTQTLTVTKDSNISVTQTLTLTQVGEKTPGLPAIVGYTGGQTRYAFSIDIDANQELHRLNEDTVFNYPASCTKLMTLLLIMEYKGSVLDSSSVTVTSADTSIFGGSSVAGLIAGDQLTWRELLNAIVVPSGGDACQCAARIIGTEIYVAAGSTGNTGMTRFIERMNARAAELGMTNTFYYDSWGESTISGSVRNSITARDLATLLGECIAYSDLNTVLGTATYTKVFTSPNSHTCNWSNVNRMVNGPTQTQSGIKGDNVIGGKVGEWNGDGTHVNLANAWIAPNGNRIVTVVMNAPNYQSLSWDHLGLMYSAVLDWQYLVGTTDEGVDTNFSKVRILAASNGSGVIDESSYGRTATNNGAAISSTPFLLNSDGSFSLTATDYVTFPDSSDYEIGSGDATIEVWYKAPIDHNPTQEELWFLKYATNNLQYAMNWYPTAIQIFASTTGTGWSSQIITGNTTELARTFFNGAPRHIAWVKSGSTITGYLNGEKFTPTISMSTIFDGNGVFRIGGDPSVGSWSAVGTYGDLRLSTALARYTADKHTLQPFIFPRSATPAEPSSNALTISQTVGLSKDVVRDLTSTLSLTDTARKTTDASGDSTLSFSEALTFEKYKVASATSALALTHNALAEITFSRSVNHGLPMSQLLSRNITKVLDVVSTLAATQLAVAVVTRPTFNTLTLTQLAEAVVAKIARNLLEVGQSLDKAVTYNRNTADNFIPFQILTAEATYRRSLGNTLTLAQTLVGQVVKSAHSTLSLSQSVTVVNAKPGFNILVPTQTVAYTRAFGKTATSPVALSQTVQVGKAKAVSILHGFGMNTFARGTRVLNAATHDDLALVYELVREYKYGVATDNIDLAQVVDVSKLATAEADNVLTLSQTVEVAKTLVRSIVDTLVFKTSFEKYVGIGGHETVSVPAVQVVKVKKVVTLQSDSLVIVLPAPEFNDSEGGTGRINIKRTMAGGRRVYSRDNVTSKLNYQFIIDRMKAIELRNFIMNSNTKFLRLENWKGEIWACQMTNSPFSFGEDAAWLGSPGGNKSSITLEFEGVRLN